LEDLKNIFVKEGNLKKLNIYSFALKKSNLIRKISTLGMLSQLKET
jgi:hypothetical protein